MVDMDAPVELSRIARDYMEWTKQYIAEHGDNATAVFKAHFLAALACHAAAYGAETAAVYYVQLMGGELVVEPPEPGEQVH